MYSSRLMTSINSKFTFTLLLVTTYLQLVTVIGQNSFDSRGNETDYTALLAIKSRLIDRSEGVLTSWNDSVHHCVWEGVSCGRKHNRVVSLDLYSRGLAGTISPFIGNLTFLSDIKLYNNHLSGEIQPEFGLLTKLQTLDLENNTFVGGIPANLSGCVNLRYLSVAGNKLEGDLPKSLGALSRLETLSVQHNTLTGPLFDVITNLTSLKFISANSNAFTGTIPSSIGRLQNLTKFHAALNDFSGVVPLSLFNLSSLQELVLANNRLQGRLPADISLTLPRLTELNIAHNKFYGDIPHTILNLTGLEYIALEENQFTGEVPREFGRHQKLDSLLLDANYLIGDISFISTLVNCSRLTRLDLRFNNFTGTLPKTIANLSTTLTWLALGYSPITGVIPAGITNLVNLMDLEISTTQVAGTIPPDLWKLRNLEWVNLGSNRLTGNIHESFGNISRLSGLYLDSNRLKGSIPQSLGRSRNLLYLFLSDNELDGNLEKELLDGPAKFLQLGLSRNRLEGSIPVEISNQKSLSLFYASENKLSGVIPDGLGSCIDLQNLDLHGNNFRGYIPQTFRGLSGLQTIDLSSNNLSGEIPTYFSKFPLLYLNVSYNDFEGVVPTAGVFTNVSAVSVVGNRRLCGGISELQLPKCVQQNKRKKNKTLSSAVKLTIMIVSVLGGVLIVAISLYLICCRKSTRSVLSGSVKREASPNNVSYNMLLKATDGFSSENLLGSGHFGSVFKGILDGKTVAVKVLNLEQRGASKSFTAECKALRNIRHRNLVGIITACSSMDYKRNDFKALVYEFMPNGSLDSWLHEARNLTLLQRVDIAIDMAHALNYLHHECEIPIVHCDLKPSNVLLDSVMVARVGDFGLAKFLAEPESVNRSSTVGIRGTVGYVAPEYGLGSEASTEGDLYSYGILLLELITGKRPTNTTFEENMDLRTYVEAALPDRLLQIIDSTLADNETTEKIDDHKANQDAHLREVECIVSVVNIGLACSKHLPRHRMKITDAITGLQAAKDRLLNVRHRQKF